ncbi:hypothetical protein OESDEN_07874, partial [Oesophagostomum dentatum]
LILFNSERFIFSVLENRQCQLNYSSSPQFWLLRQLNLCVLRAACSLIYIIVKYYDPKSFVCRPINCLPQFELILLNYNSGCGGCSGVRAYRLPYMQMAPAYGCGGGRCRQMIPILGNPCNNGGCGGTGQQIQYGIPDPIYTESGRIIRAPFLPPPALPPQRVGQNPMVNSVTQV